MFRAMGVGRRESRDGGVDRWNGDPSSWVHQKPKDPKDSVLTGKELRGTKNQVNKGQMPREFRGQPAPKLTRDPIQCDVQVQKESEQER
jgi:hypothetical protein